MQAPEHHRLERTLATAQQGDANATEQLVIALAPKARMMVTVRLGQSSWQAIDECTQDCLVALADGVTDLHQPSLESLSAWLSTVVRNRVADFLRRESRDQLAHTRSLPLAADAVHSSAMRVLEKLTGGGGSPSSHAARHEYLAVLLEELRELPDRQRQAVTLAFFDQLNSTQVGQAMGLKRTAAAQLIKRGVQSLRQRWRRRQPGEASG